MPILKIELKYDADTAEQEEIMRDAARMAAKHLFATSALISKTAPEIGMTGHNFFEGHYEISLADDLE